MAKQVYYLQNESLPKVQTSFPIITWMYKWNDNGRVRFEYSQSMKELIGYYYWTN